MDSEAVAKAVFTMVLPTKWQLQPVPALQSLQGGQVSDLALTRLSVKAYHAL
jgi:hypothetical protein